ncbi:helix-turn-helix domain-containing protein [Lactiplantibacillus mudanjiangensis]|uniref:AraC-type DNA-binding protein [Lactobacillus plantarum JDM1] n=1 Tax=Lactiplantibacillus mudanjiangensis TaxID=1296538 RepID=A0A660E3R2_9LACO|nr:helix-turn-helix transcriptional regulator [Lactiplantibacillus mudanjiangensis]VDG20235.1 AraC-type DNA-binding protein [Lactobacillus plantarum JDM1] [Lactiplantibacillus mudanjiangensis]VDG24070.1 AraC-type DNA-binding protein [Lactobacillus plantarum JDM1] [Lactiplantibacillus mudanjiangensis]VDG30250.1 AraC-type DNA-binding protein [Lactobacillus plantarum JDM1] [Lactiplantibacillus mudanjiangensis]
MAKTITITTELILETTDFDETNQPLSPETESNSKCFHIRLIESLTTCELFLNGHYVSLSPFDVIMLSSDQPVTLKNLTAPAQLRVFSECLHAPTPLNMVVVGDNPMVHDLMNAGEHEPHYIVYRHLTDQLKHRYFDLLAEIECQNLHDVFLSYQREMAAGLLLTELLRNHEQTISISDSDFPGTDLHHASADTQSGLIFNYLVLHSQNATLQGTATHFGYDKNYFSRLCRKLFDKSFTGQLAFIRIELAKRMLALSNKTIEEIAFELGYKNSSSFFAVFKRDMSMTPNDYRASHGYRRSASHD